MASPNTIARNKAIDERAAAVREEVAARYAKSHPSKPRTSSRWLGGNKGLPFSRMVLKDTIPGTHGMPAHVVLHHPTRGGMVKKVLTPDLMRVFFPSMPEPLARQMLGIA